MRNKAFILLCGIPLLGYGAASYAATTINFSLKQAGQGSEVAQSAYIDDGKVLIKAAGGDPNYDLLFEQANETMTIIDHNEKTTLDINAQKVAALANQAQGMMDIVRQQLMLEMEDMSEEQRQKVETMIASLGGGQLMQVPPPPQPKAIKDIGAQTINGYSCQKMEVWEGDDKISEVCTAKPEEVGIPAEDYGVIQAMQAMSQKLREQTAKISTQMGQNVPQFGHTETPGVPVQMKDKSGNTMTITQVQSGIGDASLSKPEGYTPKQMPTIPQLTQ